MYEDVDSVFPQAINALHVKAATIINPVNLFNILISSIFLSKLCALRDIVNHPYVNHISFLCEDWVIEWRKFQKPTYGELSDYLTKSRGFSKSFFHGIMIVTISIEYCALA